MLNSLVTFIKASEGKNGVRERNMRTIKNKQIKHDSVANLNRY